MDLSSEERLKSMLALAQTVPTACEIFHKLYDIVLKYDLPKHVDREFVYDSLIAYYSSIESFNVCIELKNCKKDKNRRKNIKFNFEELDPDDLEDLKMLGFTVPDYITKNVYYNYF